MSWKEKDFEESMQPSIDNIYTNCFSNIDNIKRNIRTNENSKSMFMDIELGIDTIITFKDGSMITLQEKTLRHTKQHFQQFTFEYYNQPKTKDKGEWFKLSEKDLMDIRNNRDLLSIKIFGFSNLKVFMLLATTSFMLGWIVLFIFTPLTSTMSKYYEKTKANYSRDIDYLLSYTKNGLWIKENLKDKQRIITAKKPEGYKLIDVKIFHYDNDSFLFEKIVAKEANIEMNEWVLKNVSKFNKN